LRRENRALALAPVDKPQILRYVLASVAKGTIKASFNKRRPAFQYGICNRARVAAKATAAHHSAQRKLTPGEE